MLIVCNEDTLRKIDAHIGHICTDNELVFKRLEGGISPDDHLYHGRAIFTGAVNGKVDHFSLADIMTEAGYENVPAEVVSTAPQNLKRIPVNLTVEQLEELNGHRGEMCEEHRQVFVKVESRKYKGRMKGHAELCDPQPGVELKTFSLNAITAEPNEDES